MYGKRGRKGGTTTGGGAVGRYRGGGVGSHYVEGGDVTDGDGWLHVRQV